MTKTREIWNKIVDALDGGEDELDDSPKQVQKKETKAKPSGQSSSKSEMTRSDKLLVARAKIERTDSRELVCYDEDAPIIVGKIMNTVGNINKKSPSVFSYADRAA